ncbi:GATA zinc finger-domain-containing protein, partial [Syncephalastrum racemosum]
MCHSCHTTQTPEWRRGPDGARTLCNACGLRMSYQRYVLQINQLVLDFRLLQVAATTLTHDSTASSTDCFYHSYTDKSDI